VIVAGLSPTIGFAITAYLVGGLGNGLESTAARLLVQARAAPADQGRAFAAYCGFGHAAAVVGTVTGAILLQPLLPRLVLELRGALSALPALCLAVLRRRRTPTL
jgi:MFS family permease